MDMFGHQLLLRTDVHPAGCCVVCYRLLTGPVRLLYFTFTGQNIFFIGRNLFFVDVFQGLQYVFEAVKYVFL